jgi:hypothetical protein
VPGRRGAGAGPQPATTRVGAVADHLGCLLDGRHMHHTTKDDLIWPKLLDRAKLDASAPTGTRWSRPTRPSPYSGWPSVLAAIARARGYRA